MYSAGLVRYGLSRKAGKPNYRKRPTRKEKHRCNAKKWCKVIYILLYTHNHSVSVANWCLNSLLSSHHCPYLDRLHTVHLLCNGGRRQTSLEKLGTNFKGKMSLPLLILCRTVWGERLRISVRVIPSCYSSLITLDQDAQTQKPFPVRKPQAEQNILIHHQRAAVFPVDPDPVGQKVSGLLDFFCFVSHRKLSRNTLMRRDTYISVAMKPVSSDRNRKRMKKQQRMETVGQRWTKSDWVPFGDAQLIFTDAFCFPLIPRYTCL